MSHHLDINLWIILTLLSISFVVIVGYFSQRKLNERKLPSPNSLYLRSSPIAITLTIYATGFAMLSTALYFYFVTLDYDVDSDLFLEFGYLLDFYDSFLFSVFDYIFLLLIIHQVVSLKNTIARENQVHPVKIGDKLIGVGIVGLVFYVFVQIPLAILLDNYDFYFENTFLPGGIMKSMFTLFLLAIAFYFENRSSTSSQIIGFIFVLPIFLFYVFSVFIILVFSTMYFIKLRQKPLNSPSNDLSLTIIIVEKTINSYSWEATLKFSIITALAFTLELFLLDMDFWLLFFDVFILLLGGISFLILYQWFVLSKKLDEEDGNLIQRENTEFYIEKSYMDFKGNQVSVVPSAFTSIINDGFSLDNSKYGTGFINFILFNVGFFAAIFFAVAFSVEGINILLSLFYLPLVIFLLVSLAVYLVIEQLKSQIQSTNASTIFNDGPPNQVFNRMNFNISAMFFLSLSIIPMIAFYFFSILTPIIIEADEFLLVFFVGPVFGIVMSTLVTLLTTYLFMVGMEYHTNKSNHLPFEKWALTFKKMPKSFLTYSLVWGSIFSFFSYVFFALLITDILEELIILYFISIVVFGGYFLTQKYIDTTLLLFLRLHGYSLKRVPIYPTGAQQQSYPGAQPNLMQSPTRYNSFDGSFQKISVQQTTISQTGPGQSMADTQGPLQADPTQEPRRDQPAGPRSIGENTPIIQHIENQQIISQVTNIIPVVQMDKLKSSQISSKQRNKIFKNILRTYKRIKVEKAASHLRLSPSMFIQVINSLHDESLVIDGNYLLIDRAKSKPRLETLVNVFKNKLEYSNPALMIAEDISMYISQSLGLTTIQRQEFDVLEANSSKTLESLLKLENQMSSMSTKLDQLELDSESRYQSILERLRPMAQEIELIREVNTRIENDMITTEQFDKAMNEIAQRFNHIEENSELIFDLHCEDKSLLSTLGKNVQESVVDQVVRESGVVSTIMDYVKGPSKTKLKSIFGSIGQGLKKKTKERKAWMKLASLFLIL